MIEKNFRNLIVLVVLVVWAINFTAPVWRTDYTPQPELNIAFMAIVGGLFTIPVKKDEKKKEEPKEEEEEDEELPPPPPKKKKVPPAIAKVARKKVHPKNKRPGM